VPIMPNEFSKKELDAELLNMFEKSKDLLLKLAKPASDYTMKVPRSRFKEYNFSMLAKYCHMVEGADLLLDRQNYYCAFIIERAMLEIKMHIRYFYGHQNEMQAFLKNHKKFTKKDIITKGSKNQKVGEDEYRMYEFLCSIFHPSIEPFFLLAVSETRKVGNLNMSLVNFGPEYNQDSRLNVLFNIVRENVGLIDTEVMILEDSADLSEHKKFVLDSVEKLNKYGKRVFWGQKSVQDTYDKLKRKRLEEIE